MSHYMKVEVDRLASGAVLLSALTEVGFTPSVVAASTAGGHTPEPSALHPTYHVSRSAMTKRFGHAFGAMTFSWEPAREAYAARVDETDNERYGLLTRIEQAYLKHTVLEMLAVNGFTVEENVTDNDISISVPPSVNFRATNRPVKSRVVASKII